MCVGIYLNNSELTTLQTKQPKKPSASLVHKTSTPNVENKLKISDVGLTLCECNI